VSMESNGEDEWRSRAMRDLLCGVGTVGRSLAALVGTAAARQARTERMMDRTIEHPLRKDIVRGVVGYAVNAKYLANSSAAISFKECVELETGPRQFIPTKMEGHDILRYDVTGVGKQTVLTVENLVVAPAADVKLTPRSRRTTFSSISEVPRSNCNNNLNQARGFSREVEFAV